MNDRLTDPSESEDADCRDERPLTLADLQQLIRKMYIEKDVARGIDGTFMWLMEEVGELASALRNGTHEERSWSLPTCWRGWRRSPTWRGSI